MWWCCAWRFWVYMVINWINVVEMWQVDGSVGKINPEQFAAELLQWFCYQHRTWSENFSRFFSEVYRATYHFGHFHFTDFHQTWCVHESHRRWFLKFSVKGLLLPKNRKKGFGYPACSDATAQWIYFLGDCIHSVQWRTCQVRTFSAWDLFGFVPLLSC